MTLQLDVAIEHGISTLYSYGFSGYERCVFFFMALFILFRSLFINTQLSYTGMVQVRLKFAKIASLAFVLFNLNPLLISKVGRFAAKFARRVANLDKSSILF